MRLSDAPFERDFPSEDTMESDRLSASQIPSVDGSRSASVS